MTLRDFHMSLSYMYVNIIILLLKSKFSVQFQDLFLHFTCQIPNHHAYNKPICMFQTGIKLNKFGIFVFYNSYWGYDFECFTIKKKPTCHTSTLHFYKDFISFEESIKHQFSILTFSIRLLSRKTSTLSINIERNNRKNLKDPLKTLLWLRKWTVLLVWRTIYCHKTDTNYYQAWDQWKRKIIQSEKEWSTSQ